MLRKELLHVDRAVSLTEYHLLKYSKAVTYRDDTGVVGTALSHWFELKFEPVNKPFI